MTAPRPKPTPTHQYYFHCPQCRRAIVVQPNQAGARVDCVCGLLNFVPSLVNLQRAEMAQTGPQAMVMPAPVGATANHAASGNPACPFCRGPMAPGRIVGERYQLKWLDDETPLTMGIWAVGGTPIGKGGFMTMVRPHINGWRCVPCGKIVVDERT